MQNKKHDLSVSVVVGIVNLLKGHYLQVSVVLLQFYDAVYFQADDKIMVYNFPTVNHPCPKNGCEGKMRMCFVLFHTTWGFSP